MYNFDPSSVFLAITTDIPQRLDWFCAPGSYIYIECNALKVISDKSESNFIPTLKQGSIRKSLICKQLEGKMDEAMGNP